MAAMFHRKFCSKNVINISNALDFCTSYSLYVSASPFKIKLATFGQIVHDCADGGKTFQNMQSCDP